MDRIVVFGNSGSGKSTYAKMRSASLGCSHMDLDTVAWDIAAKIPTRQSLGFSTSAILRFVNTEENWIVEGCYSQLLEVAMSHATEIVFLNPGTDTCIDNARSRPWESHKYSSPAAQDANLEMLIEWIRGYDRRTDEFSYKAHRQLFARYAGKKHEFHSNERNRGPQCTGVRY